SVPNTQHIKGIVKPFLFACDKGEDISACASHQAELALTNPTVDKKFYRLIGEKFEDAYCGRERITYYLHYFPPVPYPNAPAYPFISDPSIPLEIIEGIEY